MLLGTKTRLGFEYYLSAFTLYGLAVFILGAAAVAITLKSYSKKPKIFSLITFASLYLFLFSFVGVYSLYKYVKKDFGWLTK